MRVGPFPGSPLRVCSPETACTRGERFKAQWGYLYSSGGGGGLPTHPDFRGRSLGRDLGEDSLQVQVHHRGDRDGLDGQVGVLEAVPRQHAHNGRAWGTPFFKRPATEAEDAASQKIDSSLARNV